MKMGNKEGGMVHVGGNDSNPWLLMVHSNQLRYQPCILSCSYLCVRPAPHTPVRYLFSVPHLRTHLVSNKDFRPKLKLRDGLLFVKYDISDITSTPGACLAAVEVSKHRAMHWVLYLQVAL